jgi:hypothetical protein
MFDSTAEIGIAWRFGTEKSNIVIRWPTDAEWAERFRRRKILIKRLGRGVNESSIESGEADLKLYDQIKLNGAPPLTVQEASFLIDRLTTCEVLGVEVEGEEATVTMNVLAGRVCHRMKLPTVDQVMTLRRQAVRMFDLPYNVQEIRIILEPGARLWDACSGQGWDYTGGIPALHKDTAIRAVIDFMDREIAGSNDEANF